VVTLGFASVALTYLSPSLFRASRPSVPDLRSIQASENLLQAVQQESARQMEERPVYPYSLVPGGVRNVKELKWAVDHDPVVAAHYAGFNFRNARLVQLLLARSVYVSYRVGNRVYWTRRRVQLKKGETLISDGKLAARTRCGNRVEEQPQQATAHDEPPAEKFDEPVRPAVGTAVAQPPVPFESALLNRPPVPGLGPAPPLGLYDPLGGGSWTPIAPPPLPSVCGIDTQKHGSDTTVTVTQNGKKKNVNVCEGTGAEVPEPGTWLLVASGLGGLYWKARQRLARI
jgi:hypothetical protein